MKRSLYPLQSRASPAQLAARKKLLALFQKTPLPTDHLLVSLGLYQRSTAIAKLLYLHELYQHILMIPGIIMEFGIWYGNTMVQLGNLRAVLEPYNFTRKIVGFDTFTGYEGFSQNDTKSPLMKQGQYRVPKNYEEYLKELLAYHEEENILSHIPKTELVKGDATKTCEAYFKKHPETIVSLAIFDMQVYKPTKSCLAAVLPHLVRGSVVAMDELASAEFPGETKAFRQTIGLAKYKLFRSWYLPDRTYAVVE
jgi:hypothetical protein